MVEIVKDRTFTQVQWEEIKKKRCSACSHGINVDTCSLQPPARFPQCIAAGDFRLIEEPNGVELWQHRCSTEGVISVAKGCACDWCGATEGDQ